MKKSKNTPNSLTREWMQQALLRLLRTKELSEISVTELTRTAGVARVTFYRNYNDMADVLFDYLENPKHGLPVPGAADFYLPQFIRDYFQFFHDNRALVFCIQKNNLLPRLMVTLEKISAPSPIISFRPTALRTPMRCPVWWVFFIKFFWTGFATE